MSLGWVCLFTFAAAWAASSAVGEQCDVDQPDWPDIASLLQLRNPPGAWEDHGPPEEDSALTARMSHDDRHGSCTTVFLTAVLDSGKNVVHREDDLLTPSYFRNYSESITSLLGGRAKAVILHNKLPENLTGALSAPTLSFVKVDLSDMDKHLTVVEWRWIVMFDLVRKHPEWDTVFMGDSSDVVVHHNPCALVQQHPGKLFVGSESKKNFGSCLMTRYFQRLGGKYLAWFQANRSNVPHSKMLNAGIFGGRRADVLRIAGPLEDVLLDPDLAIKKQAELTWFDMAATNYVLRAKFPFSDVITGYPLHSIYGSVESRKDVYLSHK